MAIHNRALLPGQTEAGSPGRQVNRTSRTPPLSLRFILSVLFIFTTGYVMFLIPQSGHSDQKEITYLPSFVPWDRLSPITPSQKIHNDDVYNSELLRASVETKNFSSVSEYFRNVSSYLHSFRSPMIKEYPFQYSWPESKSEKKQRESMSKTKHIVWYNPPPRVIDQGMIFQFDHCPVKDCVMSLNYNKDHAEADAVWFMGVPGNAVPPRDHADQIYIFYTLESPSFTSSGYGSTPWNTAFNWTWTYRFSSDIIDVYGYLKRSPSVPSISEAFHIMRQKKKYVAWMSSHCNVPSRRDEYIRKLQKIIPVDKYGRCGDLSCKIWSRECDLKLNEYFFYLSFENSICIDYMTEKFYKTFHEGVHVIPVARGGTNYSRFYPAGTFLDADAFSGPEELGRYLLALAQDEARYAEMLWRHNHFVYHERGNIDAHCQLCYKLHHMDHFQRTYPDMYGWYHRHGCSSPKPF